MRLGDQIASLVYPLDTFSMYSGLPGESVSHLLVRDDQGRVHRVTDFQTFACSGPVARSSSPCANDVAIAYHYDDLAHYIADHPGPGDRQVDVIDRTWRIRPGGGPEPVADCLVAHCKVSR
ncbi:MAG: hypothetical protein HY270_15250 [Deltaproteobacteria bacterium]|nr:hypothetical protein [Deltaproteobacteria bacterium]